MHECELALCTCPAFTLCAPATCFLGYRRSLACGQSRTLAKEIADALEGSHLKTSKGPWICATHTLKPRSSRSSFGLADFGQGRLLGLLWRSGGACDPSASMRRTLKSVTASPSAPRRVGVQSEWLHSIDAICSYMAWALEYRQALGV